MKGFVIGATGSGTGKTTVSLGILSWLKSRGIKVAPFKVGPDFIDPGFHATVSGAVSYNLDSWMLPRAYNRDLFTAKSRNSEIAVVEGVMGLFDGYDALSETGSTAQMAKWLDLPVVLVVSARGKARSAAAIVRGFERFDPDLRFAGVIFSQAGSERHYCYLRDAVEQNCTTPCLGYLPKNDAIVMPERHLGLVTADEAPIPRETVDILTSMVDTHLDMDRLMAGLREIPAGAAEKTRERDGESAPTARIAVARDKSFCFYYPDNIDMLRQSGAEIVYFSPLAGGSLPRDIDGIYFGGGYPELNADRLAAGTGLMEQIRNEALGGMPVYGECGGFMYLCRKLSGMDGHGGRKMCGIFDFDTRMSGRLRSLGYREITLSADTLLGKKGARIRGHEFHYSSIDPETAASRDGVDSVYQVASRAGQQMSLEGFQKKNALGSYLHVHFGSNPDAAASFVDCCAQYRRNKPGYDGNQRKGSCPRIKS